MRSNRNAAASKKRGVGMRRSIAAKFAERCTCPIRRARAAPTLQARASSQYLASPCRQRKRRNRAVVSRQSSLVSKKANRHETIFLVLADDRRPRTDDEVQTTNDEGPYLVTDSKQEPGDSRLRRRLTTQISTKLRLRHHTP